MSFCRKLSPLNYEKGSEEECDPYKCPTDLCFSEASSFGFVDVPSRTQVFRTNKPPNIEHELNVAKSLMQQCSSITGDNLFDHLADIIKRVIQDRPANIVDYFEEFSYTIREQKFRIPEQFSWTHYEPVNVEAAKSLFRLMKIPFEAEYDVCREEKSKFAGTSVNSSISNVENEKFQRKLLLNENVLRLHLYWLLCGFGFHTEEVQHLGYALQKIQFHPMVVHARFWGKIHGLRKPYYIVEALLTRSEMEKRLDMMREEMMERMSIFRASSEQSMRTKVDVDFIPGTHWQEWPEEDLQRMISPTGRISTSKVEVQFDIPPEAVGTGLNRRAYFVVNSLNEDWIELPIATPKQIQISRKIKKFLTGHLEADLVCYPRFPGNEKHYLRAMIARITSGTYIAPNGYYRRLTKKEQVEVLGEMKVDVNDEDEELDTDEDEEEESDNDAIITENPEYDPKSLELLTSKSWVHVRPNILEQGRVVYFDEEVARKALEREATLRLRGEEQEPEDEGTHEEVVDEEGDIIEDDDTLGSESGPALFTSCIEDRNEDEVVAWSPRYSSVHNKINQLAMMRSNRWPGAYSFAFEKHCDSIYLGWGFKYNSRNMSIPHIPPIQEDFYSNDYAEKLDPTVEMEESWRLFQMKKQYPIAEEETDSCSDTT